MISIAAETWIAAPPSRVFAQLTDFASFPIWNPMIVKAEGDARLGARLKISVAAPDDSGQTFRFTPVITAFQPGKALAWKGSLPIPGLFDGLHFWRLIAEREGTRLVHGEDFSGLMVSLMGRKRIEAFLPGYQAMNAALKARVEG
jgi:hypothetical protein